MEGYYAFQDYAVLHWVDHLEASMSLLTSETLEEIDGIGGAINDFYEAYGADDLGSEDILPALRARYQHIEDAEFSENLLLLLTHTRECRKKDETLSGLGDLGISISKNRSILEDLRGSASLSQEVQDKLEQYYGPNWSKCPRHACYHFHEGFSAASGRDDHVNRHEKPFCCTEPSCPRLHLGFSTERDLKRHMSINHPDPAAFAWRFPKTPKPPPKFVCDSCPKEFTRAHNLKAHQRTACLSSRFFPLKLAPLTLQTAE